MINSKNNLKKYSLVIKKKMKDQKQNQRVQKHK